MPRVVDADERRARITNAAARLIAAHGLEAATMRDVAREAGLTTGAVTHYFADKRELLLRTFEASLASSRTRRTTQLADPVAALRAALEGALPLDEDRRRHWMVTVAFCSQSAGDVELARTQRDAYRQYRNRVAGLVRLAGIEASASASRAVAERFIAAADGVAIQALFDPDGWLPARQLATLDALLG